MAIIKKKTSPITTIILEKRTASEVIDSEDMKEIYWKMRYEEVKDVLKKLVKKL